MPINQNEMAKKITENQLGKLPKYRQPIGQIKEHMREVLFELAQYPIEEVDKLLKRYR